MEESRRNTYIEKRYAALREWVESFAQSFYMDHFNSTEIELLYDEWGEIRDELYDILGDVKKLEDTGEREYLIEDEVETVEVE